MFLLPVLLFAVVFGLVAAPATLAAQEHASLPQQARLVRRAKAADPRSRPDYTPFPLEQEGMKDIVDAAGVYGVTIGDCLCTKARAVVPDPLSIGPRAWKKEVERQTEAVVASEPTLRFCEAWAKFALQRVRRPHWETIEAASADAELLALSYHQQVSRDVQFCWCKLAILKLKSVEPVYNDAERQVKVGQCRVEAHKKYAGLLRQAPQALLATTDAPRRRQQSSTMEQQQQAPATEADEGKGHRSMSLSQAAAAKLRSSAALLLSTERMGAEMRAQQAAALRALSVVHKTATEDVPAELSRMTMAQLRRGVGGGVGGDGAISMGGTKPFAAQPAGLPVRLAPH